LEVIELNSNSLRSKRRVGST